MNKLQTLMKTASSVCCLSLAMGLALNVQAVPTITDVTAQQRYPWNGKFDISYTATGVDEECAKRLLAPALTVYAVERTTHVTNVAKAAYLSGDMAMTNGTHKIVWDMDAQGIFQGVVSTNFEVFISAEVTASGVQLWKDGPYWAEYNVGAIKEEEPGYYFWWGDVSGYKRNANNDGWISLKDGTAFEFKAANCPTRGKDVAALKSAGYVDESGNLVAAHDAATVQYGAPWRMPTDAEMKALIENCTTQWVRKNGQWGRIVTGKGDYANRSIFIPAAGGGDGSRHLYPGNTWDENDSTAFYWSSSPSGEYPGFDEYDVEAWGLYFYSSSIYSADGDRYTGQNVRAVRTAAQ